MSHALARFAPILAVLIFLTACDDSAAHATKPLSPPIVGLEFKTLDDQADRLEHYRGKLVLINVWATWCAPCRREMPGLQWLAQQVDPNKIAVIGIAIDRNPMLVREYLRDGRFPFARFVDAGGANLAQHFDMGVVPQSFLLDKQGQVIWKSVGELVWEDPGIVKWLKGLS